MEIYYKLGENEGRTCLLLELSALNWPIWAPLALEDEVLV